MMSRKTVGSASASMSTARRVILVLALQGLLLASLAPRAVATDDPKAEEPAAKKGPRLVMQLRKRNFEKRFKKIGEEKTETTSVVMVYMPSRMEDFEDQYKEAAVKVRESLEANGKSGSCHFYRINIVENGKTVDLLEDYFGEGASFDTFRQTGKNFRIYMVKDGALKQGVEIGTARPAASALDPDWLVKEVLLKHGGAVFPVEGDVKYEDVYCPNEYAIDVIAYFPTQYSFMAKAYHSFADEVSRDARLFFYEARSPDFFKTIPALGQDFEMKPDTVLVYRHFDDFYDVFPASRTAAGYKMHVSDLSMPVFWDEEERETRTDFVKVHGKPFYAYHDSWYGRSVYRIEFAAVREEWPRMKSILYEAMKVGVNTKAFNKMMHAHPATPERNTRLEHFLEFKNDTADILVGAVHQKKATANGMELFWKLDLEDGKELTVDYVVDWMKKLASNEIMPMNDKFYGVKSERKPKFNSGAVKKVVGFTFDEFVNSGKNVLIYIYAQSNDNRKAFAANELKDIAKSYDGQDDITFAKINGPKNLIKDKRFDTSSYPQLYFVNIDMEVTKYEGMQLKEDIIEFIEKTRTKIFTRDEL